MELWKLPRYSYNRDAHLGIGTVFSLEVEAGLLENAVSMVISSVKAILILKKLCWAHLLLSKIY